MKILKIKSLFYFYVSLVQIILGYQKSRFCPALRFSPSSRSCKSSQWSPVLWNLQGRPSGFQGMMSYALPEPYSLLCSLAKPAEGAFHSCPPAWPPSSRRSCGPLATLGGQGLNCSAHRM